MTSWHEATEGRPATGARQGAGSGVVDGLVVLVAVISALGAFLIAGCAEYDLHAAQGRLTTLEHACIPADTGGGVTQCLQPPATIPGRALRPVTILRQQLQAVTHCVDNPAYAGVTRDDDRQLFEQCLADAKQPKAAR
jgi:hypothetical protein